MVIVEPCFGHDQTLSVLKQSKKAATKLSGELLMDIVMENITLMKLLSLDKDIHVKAREASQNSFLDMREFFRINKALQSS